MNRPRESRPNVADAFAADLLRYKSLLGSGTIEVEWEDPPTQRVPQAIPSRDEQH